MLSFIHIENVALIKQLDIDFLKGFTAVTGETGSGKSMIIDSINFVLGQRPKKDIIRNGENECFVYAVFDNISDELSTQMKELAVEAEDDGTLMISRKLTIDGKSVSKINNRTVPISTIKTISTYLIAINEQHDSFSLLNDSSHIDYVDKYSGLTDSQYECLLSDYKSSYDKFITVSKKLKDFVDEAKDRDQKLDFLKYQKKEIEGAKIVAGEEERLLSDRDIIKNSELISNAVKGTLTLLSGGMKPGAYDKILSACDNIEKIKSLVQDGDEVYSKLTSISYDLNEVIKKISTIDTGVYDDPTSALDKIETRLEIISRMKSKYGDTEEDIIAYLNSISETISEFEQYDFTLAEYENELSQLLADMTVIGEKLQKHREKTTEKLSKLINDELAFLDMDKVKFKVNYEKLESPNTKGLYSLCFFVQTNPGEPYKSLSAVASGGELSRVMLALKKVLSCCDSVECVIFDEIDTGVSGKTSSKIGISLKHLSKEKQVICITHSAQVSAIADSHLKVSKKEVDGRMFTSATFLDNEDRVLEIARILGGVTITDSVIKTATELLEQGNNI